MQRFWKISTPMRRSEYVRGEHLAQAVERLSKHCDMDGKPLVSKMTLNSISEAVFVRNTRND